MLIHDDDAFDRKGHPFSVSPAEYAGLVLLLLAYAFFLHSYFVPVYSGVDPNGYHVSARRLLDTGSYHATADDDLQFIGRMWVVNERGEYYAKYPPLYPALCAGAMKLFGERAGFYINPICAFLAILGIYLLGRAIGLGAWALFAAFALAVNPVYGYYAVRQVSHASSIAFLVWGYALFFCARHVHSLRAMRILALLGGVLVGYAAGIRYTNVLLALPLLFLVIPDWRHGGRQRLLLFLLGLALPRGYLAWHHAQSFGSPLRTGYSLTGEQPGFGWEYFLENFRFYVAGLLGEGIGPLTGLALLGWILVLRERLSKAFFYLLWILPLLLLYVAYYWAPESRHLSFLRFVIPMLIPAFLLASYCVRHVFLAFAPTGPARTVGVTLLTAIVGLWGIFATLQQVEPLALNQRRQLATVETLRAGVPSGSLVFSNMPVLNFLDFLQCYRLYPDEILNRGRLRQMVERARDPGPAGLQKDRALLLGQVLLDNPNANEVVDSLLKNALLEDKGVYLVGDRRVVQRLRAQLLPRYEFATPQRVHLDTDDFVWLPTHKMNNASKRRRAADTAVWVLRMTRARLLPMTGEQQLEALRQELSESQQDAFAEDPDNRTLFNEIHSLQRQIDNLQKRIRREKREAEKRLRQENRRRRENEIQPR